MADPVAVLGGGNGAHAAVVDLCVAGFDVRWWVRRPEVAPRDGLRHRGVFGEGVVHPSLVSDDVSEVVAGAGLVVVPLPATAQATVLGLLTPTLAAGQVVAFLPGTFGSALGAARRPDVVWLEVGTLPYLARVTGHGEVAIPVRAHRLPTGSIPGGGPDADRAHAVFSAAYPASVRVEDGLDAALTNWGPVIHPPLLVHNLGAIESLAGRFDIHAEGTSPAVRRTMLALDTERITLRRALGIGGEHWPLAHHHDRDPRGMYPPDGHEALVASGLWRESISLDHRYFSEDVELGLVLNESIGAAVGHPMPITSAIIDLLAAAVGRDVRASGRTLASLEVGDLAAARRLAAEGAR
ncbi:MAG: NAD/NADP octopine/nopaline dehydrogenase family protein [Actinomycetota bacterium]|nr:NAD/NADP octopine/nopaline dehydrogenase family protein [Actinomycetota bacterium]